MITTSSFRIVACTVIGVSVIAAPPLAVSAERCAPVEAVPGVKIRPAGCPPPATPAFQRAKPDERLQAGDEPGFYSFGDTRIKIGGRVRVEGGYVSPP